MSHVTGARLITQSLSPILMTHPGKQFSPSHRHRHSHKHKHWLPVTYCIYQPVHQV